LILLLTKSIINVVGTSAYLPAFPKAFAFYPILHHQGMRMASCCQWNL